MKYSILLLLAVFGLVSCSRDESSATTTGSNKLQKVVFYHNSPNERQWVIENNFLTKIVMADETLAEEFIYDNQHRVIADKKYTNGILSSTDVITYNSDNTIRSINDLPYFYDAATHTYTYTYGSDFTINCEVNSDQLVLSYTREGSNAGQYQMTYANGNMTSYAQESNGAAAVVKNFHFDAGFGTNPAYAAVLAVARVKSLTDPSFFIDGQASATLANGFDKGTMEPFHYNYGATPDIEGKLFQIGVEVLDSNNNNVGFYSFADYYYL
jgi:hypothetical protein